MSKIVVNNVELTLNLLDADEMEKYETEMQAVSTTIKDNAQYAGLSVPQAMRKQCRIIEAFFDKLFGAGTAENCSAAIMTLVPMQRHSARFPRWQKKLVLKSVPSAKIRCRPFGKP